MNPATRAPAIVDETVVEPVQYISWPAVFAGNAVTGGLILLMLPLAAAGSLSLMSPYSTDGASAATVGWATIIFLAFMYLSSIFAGGYVAGRLRPRVTAGIDEVRFRDGVTGIVFWGVGMIVSALFTFLTIQSAATSTVSAVGQVASGVASTAGQSLAAMNSDYLSDIFLRPAVGPVPAPAGATRSEAEIRGEIGRILAASVANGQVPESDRQYLATLVSQRAGLTEADAKARVDATIQRGEELRADAVRRAKAAAETARSTASQAAFWTAILSLLSGLAAMYAAQLGGRHRDEDRFL